MRLPGAAWYRREWHVNEETYTVKLVKRIPGCGANTLGLCDPGTHTIYIKKGQTKSQMFRTFLHEIRHAQEAEYGIDLPHKTVYQLERADADFYMMNF